MGISVFMVAEKPSLAGSISEILSGNRHQSRRGALDVHEWEGSFRGQPALFRMTSVIGHVYSLDFPGQYNSWDKTDPIDLFDAKTVRLESNPKAHICDHLQREARGCDYLVLWLDCDREGENICFEVMENTVDRLRSPHHGKQSHQQVFRARFSAITAPEIKAAMSNLGVPNENEALAVDARQELDLKVGVAFTRFQTRYFHGKYGNLDAAVVSYGPCQTPTLNFCVERHQLITGFQPEPFWVVKPQVNKGGTRLDLEWDRGRVFDMDVGTMYSHLVKESKQLKVVEVVEKEERKSKPPGLNTVELLKVASSSLNIGPAVTMQLAERLYTQGFISYPRTESSAYPPNFDLTGTLAAQRSHPVWGAYAAALLSQGLSPPKGGVDVGDHPPITPVYAASEAEIGGGDAWRLYDYISRHFLGSISPDATSRKTRAVMTCAGETFYAYGCMASKPGFTAIMPWKATANDPLPNLQRGEVLSVTDVVLHAGKTSPPDYLTEAELIGLMEKYGIGTDASISTHINNICERNYVTIQSGRRVVPTELGITLIKGYQLIDPELCKPQVRAHVEAQIGLIAAGKADKAAVVSHTLEQFRNKFLFFVAKISRMDALFEASFSPLSSSGKPLSKCGKCRRYMKFISSRPSRLYCATCEDIYNLPQGGSIKLYKGLVCPLDDFEIVLYSLTSGQDGKTYPLCPYCYNYPPFEEAGDDSTSKASLASVSSSKDYEGDGSTTAVGKVASTSKTQAPSAATIRSGMTCSSCPHPSCAHSLANQGVMACPECGVEGETIARSGTLVLDPVSGPKWRLDCNRCSFLVYLPPNLHSAKVTKDTCEECGSRLLLLDWKKGLSPLPGDEITLTACLTCDEALSSKVEVKHGKAFVKRSFGGRGRGRGRRGRGKGRGRGGKDVDPRMTFHGF